MKKNNYITTVKFIYFNIRIRNIFNYNINFTFINLFTFLIFIINLYYLISFSIINFLSFLLVGAKVQFLIEMTKFLYIFNFYY